jgi:hypothetical protein
MFKKGFSKVAIVKNVTSFAAVLWLHTVNKYLIL